MVLKEVTKHKVEATGKGKSNKTKENEDVDKISFIRKASIHTMFGGPHIDGSGRSAMDRYVREVKKPPLTNVNHLIERYIIHMLML